MTLEILPSSEVSYLDESFLWNDVVDRLSPYENNGFFSRLVRLAPIIVEIPVAIVVSIVSGFFRLIQSAYEFLTKPKDPKASFQALLKDPNLWEKLDLSPEKVILGKGNKNFHYGLATCTYQDSGASWCPKSQWVELENKFLLQKSRSGKSGDLYGLYQTKVGRQEVIRRLREMGVNSYRFSVEMSHVLPEAPEFKGKSVKEAIEKAWNKEAMKVYVDLCKDLRDAGIEPTVTLHHFSESKWFYDRGSFSNEENIPVFVEFSKKVTSALSADYKKDPLVKLFCTINEPGIEAFSRYVRGAFLPRKIGDFSGAIRFLKGALKAHLSVYKELKKTLPESVKVGFVHQYLRFIPANFLLGPTASLLTNLVNNTILRFLATGKLSFKMPFVMNIDEEIATQEELKEGIADVLCVQSYVRPVIGLTGSTTLGNEGMTDMPFRNDPAAIGEAIINSFKAANYSRDSENPMPIFVTEFGIATSDDQKREQFLLRSLYSMFKAGEEIGEKSFLGCYGWSFGDNFEWDMGLNSGKDFGFFTLEGKLKQGAEIYKKVIELWKNTIEEKKA